MKALILNNKVVDLSEKQFPVARSMQWMDAPENCQVGWILIDGEITPPPLPVKTEQQLIDEYNLALMNLLDTTARQKSYKDSADCASYLNSTNIKWSAQARVFIKWRDECWAYALKVLDEIKKGQKERPSLQSFIDAMPVFKWPEEI